MRGVSVHPGVYSGEPTIEGTRMPVALIAEVYWAHGLDEIVRGWDVSKREVLVACWYMGRHSRSRIWRSRFHAWSLVADEALWHSSDWWKCPMPPRPEDG